MPETENTYKKNIPLIYLSVILMNTWFMMPISIIYFLEYGVTYTQIVWAEVFNCALVIILDVPSGSWADRLGRKRMVILAYLIWALSFLLIGLYQTVTMMYISFALWGVCEAFASGSDTALLYDSLKVQKQEDRYLKVESIIWFIACITLIFGTIIGGYMYARNKSLPWYLSSVFICFAAVVYGFIEEPPVSEKSQGRKQIEQIKEGISFVKSHPEVRFIILFSIFLILPIGIFTNLLEQPYIFSLGFDYIELGFIFAISRGVMGALTIFSEKFEGKFGQKFSLILVNLSHLIIFLMIILIQVKSIILLLFIAFFLRDYYNIISKKYINEKIPSDIRATIISTQNFGFNLTYMISLIILGYVLEESGMNSALLCLGFSLILLFVVSFKTLRNLK